jgi:branched-chain amino acid transport system permease protein
MCLASSGHVAAQMPHCTHFDSMKESSGASCLSRIAPSGQDPTHARHIVQATRVAEQILTAIRDNEPRAISLGYDINRYKLLAFVLSATLSGLAGSLKTMVLGFTTLSDVLQANSGKVILMTLLGGSGTFFGPVVGAALVVTLQEYLSGIVGGWVTVIIGAVFVGCVLAFRRGIVGELAALRLRR